MKKLIINADDFGYSEKITLGIKEAFETVLVTSTSLIVNKDYSGQALDLAREIKDVSVGIHFNLDDGKPLCSPEQVPTLVNEQGEFHDGRTFRLRLFSGKISLREIYLELEAQLTRFLSFGTQPSHIDFHHHLHLYYPILDVALQVAKNFSIKKMRTVRLYRTYGGNGSSLNFSRWRKTAVNFYRYSLHHKIKKWVNAPDFLVEPKIVGEKSPSLTGWTKVLQSLRNEDVFELCCHPGYSSGDFEATNRETELKILKSEHLRGLIETQNIIPITYDEL
jgi:predicted glycoside hydrolase/deacetylase ChbG (UPF0249 family)